jgi:hypothetical protein
LRQRKGDLLFDALAEQQIYISLKLGKFALELA